MHNVGDDILERVKRMEKNHAETSLWLFGDGRNKIGLVQQFEDVVSELKTLKSGIHWAIGLLATTAATGLLELLKGIHVP